MNNVAKSLSYFLSCALFIAAGLIATSPQQGAAQSIGAWETAANGGGAGADWTTVASIWLTNTGTGYVTPGGNNAGTSYPDTNTTPITILPGAFVTNSGSLTFNQLTVSNGALLEISEHTVTVLHNPATTYDWDIFGGLGLTAGSSGSINLSNSAVIAVENGGAVTNFGNTDDDLFANYNATNILFLNGSLYVMTGSGPSSANDTFPQATWASNSATIYEPSTGGSKFPNGLTNQTFGSFVWNWPLQSGKAEPSSKFCNFTAVNTFAIYSSSNQLIEDLPGPGFTLTAGNILVTNAVWEPLAGSAGVVFINVSGNFIIDASATVNIANDGGIGDVTFNGTAPQVLGIYGTNASPGAFNWMINSGSTVYLGTNLAINVNANLGDVPSGDAVGSLTNNGWLDLENWALVDNTNFSGSGVVSNTVGASTLTAGNGAFSGSIVGGAGSIAVTKTGPGSWALSGANTYTGNTTISGGVLGLTGSGSIADSPNIVIDGGATFDVSGLSSPFALGAGQTLSNNGSTAVISGAVGTGSGTVSLTYTSGTPSLTITNGTLTLSPATTFDIDNTGVAMAAGAYIIITNATTGNPGSVAGTAPSVKVGGDGLAAGLSASLQISSGALELVVSSSSGPLPTPRITGFSLSGTTLTISATNGAASGQYVLLESTNLLLPLAQWTPVFTNAFNGSGNISLSTNIVNLNDSDEFYILKQP